MAIPEQKKAQVVRTSGQVTTESYEIADMELIFDLLSTTTYGNPKAACVREYLTNAVDANTERELLEGRPRPHKVTMTMPSSLSPYLRIRDYGFGLSQEGVTDVYRKYGKSTKTNSNALNGMLGIGAKAAFAYTNTWTVVSYHKGECLTYNATVVDRLPVIQLFNREATKEQDGLEIIIPVKSADFYDFRTEAQKILPYFGDKVVAHGIDGVRTRTIKFSGPNWKIRNESADDVIVMSYVAYPLNYSQLIVSPTEDDKKAGVRGMLTSSAVTTLSYSRTGLELHVDTGLLDFASSREQLRYTDRTKRAITIAFEDFVLSMRKEVTDRITAAKTEWEARNILSELIKGNSIYSALGSTGEYVWQGKKMSGTDHVIRLPKTNKTCYALSRRRNSKLTCQGMDYVGLPSKDTAFFLDDVDSKRLMARVQLQFEEVTPEVTHYVVFNADGLKEALTLGFQGIEVIKMSALPLPAPKKRAVGTAQKSKYSYSCFQFARKAYHRSWGSASQSWEKAVVDFKDGDGVYVIINSFRNSKYDNAKIADLLDKLEAQKVVIPEIIGIKPAQLEKKTLGAGWVTFEDWLMEQITLLQKHKSVSEALALRGEYLANVSGEYSDSLRRLLTEDTLIVDKNSPFAQLVEDYSASVTLGEKIKNSRLTQLEDIMRMAGVSLPNASANGTSQTLSQRLMERYPMALLLMEELRYSSSESKHRKAVEDYISLVDAN